MKETARRVFAAMEQQLLEELGREEFTYSEADTLVGIIYNSLDDYLDQIIEEASEEL